MTLLFCLTLIYVLMAIPDLISYILNKIFKGW